ncbi:MAG: hypothetical protein FWG13_07715, partial [Leptospirales bacterium]|nr:hypothetical protein [Leptospirales bacterium]
MSRTSKPLDEVLESIRIASEPIERIQRQLKDITAGIDLSHVSKALLEAMHPLADIAASYDFSYVTKALTNAMLPLISNQQLYTAQLDSMKNVTASIVSAIDVPLMSEY